MIRLEGRLNTSINAVASMELEDLVQYGDWTEKCKQISDICSLVYSKLKCSEYTRGLCLAFINFSNALREVTNEAELDVEYSKYLAQKSKVSDKFPRPYDRDETLEYSLCEWVYQMYDYWENENAVIAYIEIPKLKSFACYLKKYEFTYLHDRIVKYLDMAGV